tara:strand:+ start:14932 stop:15660 length:729 start_codon:yes stop_codon:yes gene_type:complete
MIYADDRENEVLLHKLIASLGDRQHDPKGNIIIKRLPVGDYAIGDWLVEAKEINDLYRSILGLGRNGRTINHQLNDLCETTENPILLIYGTQLKPYFGKRVSPKVVAREVAKMRRVIKSFKMTMYLRFPKLRCVDFATMDDFVEWISVVHTRKTMKKTLTADPTTYHIAKTADKDPRIIALTAIPGVTQRIANDLMDTFGSIPKMLRTKTRLKAVMGVRGVGRVLAKRILSLRENWVKEDNG